MSVPLDQMQLPDMPGALPPVYPPMQLPDMPMLPSVSGPTFTQGLGAFLTSPQAQGMASALLQAGGPSRTPVSLGQALGSATPYMQQYAQQNAQQQRMFQLQQALMRLRQMSTGSSSAGS